MVPAAAAVDLRSICQKVLKHSNLTLFPSNRRYTQKSQYTEEAGSLQVLEILLTES